MIRVRRRLGLLWLPRCLPRHERRQSRELLRAVPHTESPQAPAVTYLCHAGLANRLRLHAMAYAYAERHNRLLHVHWPITEHFAARFEDLFVPRPMSRISTKELAFIGKDEFTVPPPDVPLTILRHDCQFVDPTVLVSYAGGFTDRIRRDLQPCPAISQEIERFAATIPWPAIGTHIRFGDFKDNGQALPLDRFVTAIRAYDQRTGTHLPIFLASDGSHEELAPLFATMPGRIHRRRGSSDRFDQTALADALVDLLLLARCRHIIWNQRSSFGQFACFLGDCTGEAA